MFKSHHLTRNEGDPLQSSAADGTKKPVVIYITRGVMGGEERRRELLLKFHEFVDMGKTPQLEAVFPRWKDLPFPTQVTCAVSDDLKEERTEKLLRQGVLIVKSNWILSCVIERRLNLPIDEQQFRLFYDSSSAPAQLAEIPPLIHVKSSNPKAWSKPQDDLIEAIHRARIAGNHDKARLYESFLVERGRTREHIQDREKFLFGWSASLFE